MFYKLIIFLTLCTTTTYAETSNSFRVDKSAGKLYSELRANYDKAELSVPPEVLRALDLADLSFNLYYRPHEHYVKITINLEDNVRRLNGFNKTLEIWSKPDGMVIKSTVDINFGRPHRLKCIDFIKEKIIRMIECKILEYEQKKLIQLAN
jgi:hypothetical protein